MPLIRSPQDCGTMVEVRAAVDDLDRQIVALLARRFGYMDAAARIKPNLASVRDEVRKAEVLAKVISEARARGLDEGVIGELYDQLIEASISHETEVFERIRA